MELDDSDEYLKKNLAKAILICTCIYGPDYLLRDGQTALRPLDYIKNKRDKNKPFIIACGFARSHML